MPRVDVMVKVAQGRFPDLRPLFVVFDDDAPQFFVTMAPSLNPKPTETQAMFSIVIPAKSLMKSSRERRSRPPCFNCIGRFLQDCRESC